MISDELKHGTLYVNNKSSILYDKSYCSILYLNNSSIKFVVLREGKVFYVEKVPDLKEIWDDKGFTYSDNYLKANLEDEKELFSLLFREYERVVFKL